MKLVRVTGESYGVRFGFAKLIQNFVEGQAVAKFILRHRRKSDVFFQQGAEACPLGVTVANDQLVIGDLIQKLLDG